MRIKRRQWLKPIFVLLTVLFLFQSYPPLCGACLTGECGPAGRMQAMTNKASCHDAMPAGPCRADRGSHDSDSGKGTCPSCHCRITGALDAPERTILYSTAPLPVGLVCEVTDLLDHAWVMGDDSFPDPPGPLARSHPLFVLNSSFLI